jgi:hypothetical protein
MKKIFYHIFALLMSTGVVFAGNPDRQGEAGAYELLMNPWARSAGLHSMNTANVQGVEANWINVAGLSRINKTEVVVGNADYLRGTDIRMNAFGLSQKMGKSSAFSISLMALDFGDIKVTTTELPEGTGATFRPSFFNIGFGYAHTFENKVSVGILLRGVSESIADVGAFGFAIDAGVQYVTGDQDNFKFGISLRNIGSRMTFGGEGLSVQGPRPGGGGGYELTFNQRTASFELPSMLNIGLSYDFYLSDKNRLTALGNFTANSFSEDMLGGGLEYGYNNFFMVRGGYRYDFGQSNSVQAPLYSGPSAGATVELPLSKENKKTRLGIDYAWRQTNIYNGTHNIGVRLSI